MNDASASNAGLYGHILKSAIMLKQFRSYEVGYRVKFKSN